MFKAEIVADSLSPQGERITSMLLTYPRIIHGEFMTHRMFSRNAASSRAIPFKKMVKDVQDNPFIPLAWQKHHSGMQGTEYLSSTEKFNLPSFMVSLYDTLNTFDKESKEYIKLSKELDEKLEIIDQILKPYEYMTKTLPEWWLFARDKAVEMASILYVFGTTKQLCNRLLEPFQYITVLATATEWENFFKLRCPLYYGVYRSQKDLFNNRDVEKRRRGFHEIHNDSQAEIHIQHIAELIWDARNESTPKQLKAGEWHIPFGDKLDWEMFAENYGTEVADEMGIKIATARCARLSYMTLGAEPKIDYEADTKLHDMLLESEHMSPFEHCAKAMDDREYRLHNIMSISEIGVPVFQHGWCRNFKGFIQYRALLNK